MTTPPTGPGGRHRAAESAVHEEVSAERFRSAFRGHPGGVSVITADAGAGPVALTATSVASVSVEPPALTFSVSEQSSSAPTLREADTVVVHLLAADQLDLAELGATSGIDRFADTSIWRRLPTGEPYFPAARTWMRGRITARLDVGDPRSSSVLVVEALEISGEDDRGEAAALVYHDRVWHRLGAHSRIAG
ncbi:flavin reductase family protein [Nocardia aurea]|uniref:Flavin reductase family protein n=1 Tax=Nocardia aurea TaxID=2144174 RepID=A0ABV3FKX7_9NOCA